MAALGQDTRFMAFFKEAERLGVLDVRAIRPDAFVRWENDAALALSGVHQAPLCHDPRRLLPNARSVLVLFFACPPFEENHSPFARYYTISNRGYFAARALADLLRGMGISALHGTQLPHRAAALRSGGTIGDNGLYYHDAWGSYVHIELIVNDAFEPDFDGEVSGCLHCGRCKEACPTGALHGAERDMEQCIRNYLYRDDMPESMRAHVDRLLGCERCQRSCPMNKGIKAVPITDVERDAMSLERLLTGSLEMAKNLIGKNLARRNHMVRQATLYIGAKRLTYYTDILLKIKHNGTGNEYLDWAFSRIIDENAMI